MIDLDDLDPLAPHVAPGVRGTLDLRVDLTPEERTRRADEIAQLSEQIHDAEYDRAQTLRHARAELVALRRDRDRVLATWTDGAEERPVAYTWLPDYEAGVLVAVRDDTGEALPGQSRALTADERQVPVPGIAPAPPKVGPSPRRKRGTPKMEKEDDRG